MQRNENDTNAGHENLQAAPSLFWIQLPEPDSPCRVGLVVPASAQPKKRLLKQGHVMRMHPRGPE